MVSFILYRNTKVFSILTTVSITFGVLMAGCGIFILNELRRHVAQQIDVDHDLRGEKHTNIVKDLLKKHAGVDKMKLIENLIKRIKKAESQRSGIKSSKKKLAHKHT
jgi:hypothetical protein